MRCGGFINKLLNCSNQLNELPCASLRLLQSGSYRKCEVHFI